MTANEQISSAPIVERIKTEAEVLEGPMIRLRREIHQWPEVGFKTHGTAARIVAPLRKVGIEVFENVGLSLQKEDNTYSSFPGILAVVQGKAKAKGPTIALTVDMDALAIDEKTGSEFTSKNPGLMHACGHDIHASVGVYVALLLHRLRDNFSGTVKIIWRPNEESFQDMRTGAAAMIASDRKKMSLVGILTTANNDLTIGFHVLSHEPLGAIHLPSVSENEGIPTQAGSSIWSVETKKKLSPSLLTEINLAVRQNLWLLDKYVWDNQILQEIDREFGSGPPRITRLSTNERKQSRKDRRQWWKRRSEWVRNRVKDAIIYIKKKERDNIKPEDIPTDSSKWSTLFPLHPEGHALGIGAKETLVKTELKGKVWSLDPDIRGKTYRDLVREIIAHTINRYLGKNYQLTWFHWIPPSKNNPKAAQIFRQAALEIIPQAQLITKGSFMVPDDNAYFGKGIEREMPFLEVMLGAAPEGGPTQHHTSTFNVNEDVIKMGAVILTNGILKALKEFN